MYLKYLNVFKIKSWIFVSIIAASFAIGIYGCDEFIQYPNCEVICSEGTFQWSLSCESGSWDRRNFSQNKEYILNSSGLRIGIIINESGDRMYSESGNSYHYFRHYERLHDDVSFTIKVDGVGSCSISYDRSEY